MNGTTVAYGALASVCCRLEWRSINVRNGIRSAVTLQNHWFATLNLSNEYRFKVLPAMPDFHYQALTADAERVTGVIDAAARGDALRELSERGLTPVELRGTVTTAAKQRRVRPAALANAWAMLADQLETGVPLLKALQVLVEQSDSQAFREIMNDLTEEVANGSALADAMEQHPSVFGTLETSVVRAGEEGAFLPESLRRIAAVRERAEATRSRIMGAIAYPALLVAVGAIVVTGMLTFFVPKFEPLFDSLRKADAMPLATTILLTVSGFLQQYGLWLVGGLMIALAASWSRLTGPAARRLLDTTLLRTWVIGPIVRDFAISRFCRVLGSLLQNGVPMLRSLDIARMAAANHLMSESIGAASESVVAGKSLAQPLADSGQFTGDVVQMLHVAEQSNKLESVLLSISDKLDVRAQRRLDLFVKMLEPALMLVMAVIVGFLVIALLMPVFESNGLV